MAAVQHSRKGGKKQIRGSCSFLLRGCFGCSHEPKELNSEKNNDQELVKLNKVNRSSTAVPVSHSRTSSKEVDMFEEEEKSSQPVEQAAVPPAYQLVSNKTEDTMMKNSENMHKLDPAREYRNTIAGQETWSSTAKLWHSASQPLPWQKKGKPTACCSGKKGKTENVLIVGDESGPTVGSAILIATLMVTLIWGKMCAIVFVAAWLYFIPCFRANGEFSVMKLGNNSNRMDFETLEKKKRVVLEGFLKRRNQRVRV